MSFKPNTGKERERDRVFIYNFFILEKKKRLGCQAFEMSSSLK